MPSLVAHIGTPRRLIWPRNWQHGPDKEVKVKRLMDQTQKIQQLIEGFLNRDEQVRLSARDELVKFGQDVVRPLLEVLDESQRLGISDDIVTALVQIGTPAVESLIAALDEDWGWSIQEIVDALAGLGDLRAIQPLITKVLINPKAAMDGVWAFVRFGEPALQALLTAFHDTVNFDEYERGKVALALCEFDDSRAMETLIATLQDDSPKMRRNAIYALSFSKDSQVVDPIASALDDQDPKVRKLAAMALGHIGGTRAVEHLIGAITDEDVTVRRSVASSLRYCEDKLARESLIAGLKDPDVDVRRYCATGLSKIPDICAFDALFDVFGDEDTRVRIAAANAVGKIGEASLIERLIAAFDTEDWRVRYSVIFALSHYREKQVVEFIKQALNAPEYPVRYIAAGVLGGMGELSAVEPLIQVMQDVHQDAPVRQKAIWALGKIGDTQAIPY
ncbi:MAG: HEAT repeat domain-containing protein, partial [Anaerolineae bacterium]